MTSDTSERGLERLICTALTGSPCDPGPGLPELAREHPAAYGAGWICGTEEDTPDDRGEGLEEAEA